MLHPGSFKVHIKLNYQSNILSFETEKRNQAQIFKRKNKYILDRCSWLINILMFQASLQNITYGVYLYPHLCLSLSLFCHPPPHILLPCNLFLLFHFYRFWLNRHVLSIGILGCLSTGMWDNEEVLGQTAIDFAHYDLLFVVLKNTLSRCHICSGSIMKNSKQT